MWRGKPRWTAASMSASITRNTYVGPVPDTAVAIATIFSSSTSISAPSAPRSDAARAALLGGRLRRRVPHGHARADAGGRVRHRPDDLVVAEDGRERRRRRAGEHAQDELAAAEMRADLAPDLAQHLGLDREQDDVRAVDARRRSRRPRGCRTRALRWSRRSARGWLATIWRASTSSARSSPPIIASAIMPVPTVAIVRCGERGHGAEHSIGSPFAGRVRPARRAAPRRGQRTAVASTKNRPVVVTSTSRNPAASSATASSSGR